MGLARTVPIAALAALALGCDSVGIIEGGDDGLSPLRDGGIIRAPDGAVTSPDGGASSTADASPGAPDGATGPAADAMPAGEPPGLVGITDRHNAARAAVGVAPLQWDPALAAIAQGWAEACIDNQPPAGLIDHNPNRADTYPGSVGENIYGHSLQATAQGAVDGWVSEQQHYDYDSNACAPGQVCGHYTQVVWAATQRVGCGLASCPLTYGSTLVCNYSPAGNNGNRPY